MKSKFSTSFLVFLYIFIDLIFMENVSINSSEIFFVQFTYHLNMNEQKRPIKTTKIIFPHCFLFYFALLQQLIAVSLVMLWYRDVV